MSLFTEIAITPQVFLESSYGTSEEHALSLGLISAGIIPCAAIRDLRGGEWSRFLGRHGRLTPIGKEVLKVVLKRLVACRRAGSIKPSEEHEWLAEAVASTVERDLGFILKSGGEIGDASEPCKVLSVVDLAVRAKEVLPATSVRVGYANSDYRRILDPLLLAARFAAFFDPYLDPSHRDYSDFQELLECLPRRANRHLKLEFHTSHGAGQWGYDSSSGSFVEARHYSSRATLSSPYSKQNYWRNSFQPLSEQLVKAGMSAEVFVWDKFEERYFATNLMSLMAGKGFKVLKHKKLHSWSRLEKDDADNIKREFEENSHLHKCHLRFAIGLNSGHS